MNTKMGFRRSVAVGLLCAGGFFTAGCGSDDSGESTGVVNDIQQETGDAVDGAGDAADEAANDAKDTAEDAKDKAGEEMGDAGHNMSEMGHE